MVGGSVLPVLPLLGVRWPPREALLCLNWVVHFGRRKLSIELTLG